MLQKTKGPQADQGNAADGALILPPPLRDEAAQRVLGSSVSHRSFERINRIAITCRVLCDGPAALLQASANADASSS